MDDQTKQLRIDMLARWADFCAVRHLGPGRYEYLHALEEYRKAEAAYNLSITINQNKAAQNGRK